jgi:hypothetical protein
VKGLVALAAVCAVLANQMSVGAQADAPPLPTVPSPRRTMRTLARSFMTCLTESSDQRVR